MQESISQSSKSPKSYNQKYTIETAENFISLFQQIQNPSFEHHALLASAHFTLATLGNFSVSNLKMHLNACITLLQNMDFRDFDLNSMMAHAYFKRAGLFEKAGDYINAFSDYQKILEVFEQETEELCGEDRLLLAQSAISVADLSLNHSLKEHIKLQHHSHHPLYYVNQSLQYLKPLALEKQDIWPTLAYAHQIAGLALTSIDTREAKEAFRTALNMAFKAESRVACAMLGDIYNSLGLLYEQELQDCPISVYPTRWNDHAMIYFTIALFFTLEEDVEQESDHYLLNQIFDTIYRALDPFLTPLSSIVLKDFIDSLIYIYLCIIDKVLPNQALSRQLADKDSLNTLAQHIFCLVSESFRRENTKNRLLEIIQHDASDIYPDLERSLDSLLQPNKNKVHYLK